MNTHYRVGSLVLLLLVTILPASAYPYMVDVNTGPDSFQLDARLFTDQARTVPTPVQSVVWFVADLDANGVPTAPAAGNILGLDDQLIFADTVDGTLLGDQAGRYARNAINVNNAYSNANIFVYLWSSTGPTVGRPGDTFDILNLGQIPAPELGNAKWVISSNMVSTTYRVAGTSTSVPEPSVLLLIVSGAVVAWRTRRSHARANAPPSPPKTSRS
jgi:hypothetical protein